MTLTQEQPTAGQLDWTNDGKLLLITFQRLIKEGGGHFAMWSRTRREALPPKPEKVYKRKMKRNAWMHPHSPYILSHYKTMSTAQMAAYLGVCRQNVSWVLNGLGVRKSHLFVNGSYPQMNRYYCDILDTETGIFYDNAVQLATALCRPKKTVQQWLSGRRKTKRYNRFVKL